MVSKTLSPGTKVRVVANASAHGCPIGSIYTVMSVYSNSGYYVQETGAYFAWADLELVAPPVPIWQELEKEVANMESQCNLLSATAKALKDAKVEEISLEELKELKRVVVRSMELSPVEEARYMSKL